MRLALPESVQLTLGQVEQAVPGLEPIPWAELAADLLSPVEMVEHLSVLGRILTAADSLSILVNQEQVVRVRLERPGSFKLRTLVAMRDLRSSHKEPQLQRRMPKFPRTQS